VFEKFFKKNWLTRKIRGAKHRLRRERALNGSAGFSGVVFEIVDLERETQAAVSWRSSSEL